MSMSMSTIAFNILARDKASRVIDRAGTNVGRTAGRMRQYALGAASGFAVLAGARGIAGVVTSSVDLEAKFSKTMNVLQATSGASGRQMKSLSALAMKMGADTVFSAQDAAQAMLELARGGIQPAQIAAGALKGTLTLAAAGELEMGEAANIAVKAMGAFGLKGRQMGQVAAALAGGANASSASVRDMSIALAQGGLAANSVGFSIQETTAILAGFSRAGLQGSDAGTSLKTTLDRLQPVTNSAKAAMMGLGAWSSKTGSAFVKANGEFKSAAQIAEILRKGTEKLTVAERKRLITQAFGSDAQRGATILARLGAAGVQKLTRATSDQNAAQRMAAANMKGTAGALEQFRGSVETAKLRLGQFLAPAVQRGLGMLTDGLNGLPGAIRKLRPGLDQLVDDVRSFAPVLKLAASALELTWHAVDALPGPVKTLGVEVAIAALVLPRLSAGFAMVTGAAGRAGASVVGFGQRLQQNRVAMTYQTTALGKAREALNGFGGAARNVAGVGGMLLLTKGAQESNKAIGGLMQVAGGAAMGFALAGPIGAAGGAAIAAAPAIWNLLDSVTGLKDGHKRAYPAAEDYAKSLDQITGAATRNTRELVRNSLIQNDLSGIARKLDVQTRDVIGAVLGQEGATRRLARATREHIGQLGGDEQAKWNTWLRNNTDALDDQRREVRQTYLDTASYKELLKGFPPKVITAVRQLGASASAKEIAALQKRYKLTPPQVRTILETVGTEASIRKVKGVWKVLDATGRRKANLTTWERTLLASLNEGQRNTTTKVGGINQLLSVGTSRARPNLQPFMASLNGTLSAAKTRAGSGGSGIGNALGAGVYNGIGAWIGDVTNRAAAMVGAAVAAAKAKAESKSPSKVMMRLGGDMGRGLVIGLERSGRSASTAGAKLIGKLVDGIRSRFVPLKTAMAKAKSYLGGAQDRLQTVRGNRRDFAASFDGFRSSVFGSDIPEGTVPTADSLLNYQAAQAAKAAQLSRDVRALTNKGLSKSLIRQLAGSGESGMAQISALATATPQQIKLLNSLDRQTSSSLRDAGAVAGNAVFGDQLRAAEADVRLAKSIAGELEKVLQRVAKDNRDNVYVMLDGRQLVAQIRREKRKAGGKDVTR